MKRFARPAAALLIVAATAGAAAANGFSADRGYDDARTYAGSELTNVAAKNVSTRDLRSDQSKDAFKGFNKKFGSPERNFESGRR